MSILNEKVLRNLFVGAALPVLAACQPTGYAGQSTVLNEYNDGSTYRTPVRDAPTDCTVYTQESGTVNGGYVTYGRGTAERTCVSSPYSGQREYGTNPMQAAQESISQATSMIYAIQGLNNALNY